MAKENWQKLKLVKLIELLRQESDEEHPLSTNVLCSRLAEMGYPCDRRTLSKDIAVLNDNGMEVLWKWVGKEKGYYVEDRSFSVPEIKILIDAVQAASFITEKKTAELVDKIANLGGTHKAEIIKSNLVCFNARKHHNENIYYNIDAIESAIQNHKKIIFRYFDLNADGERVYRRQGHHYVVEPVALVFNEDNYYVVVFSGRHDGTANYRVDRMDDVECIDEDISDRAVKLRGSMGEYTKQAIKMYGGTPQIIRLEFDSTLVGAIYDRFGENIEMKDVGNERYSATARVQLSPTFWGWLFQFGQNIKILSPDSLREEYRQKIEKLLDEGAGLW